MFLLYLGTVNKLTEQVTKNAFSGAEKKRRQFGHRRGFEINI